MKINTLQWILGSFLVLALVCCDRAGITIGIVGDQFGSHDADNTYQIMAKTLQKINRHDPDVLLHVGDIVESVRNIETFEQYELNFETAVEIMNSSSKPWLLAVGDHDVVPPRYQALSDDRSREQWFIKCSRKYNLPFTDHLFYSQNINGYHFVSLYSLENLHTDPRWGSIFLNQINDEQLAWLEKDLRENRFSRGIVILVHHPHWYVWSNWQRVHEILKKYHVVAVVAGHFHYDQDDSTIDGIRYIVMGSSGGVIKDTDAHSGGAQEYAIINLTGDAITNIQLYEVNSDSALELTPRRSMDRIQALSCMLDNLWQDISLTESDGKIIDANTRSAKIELSSLANPIDIPIQLEIHYPDSILSEVQWNRDSVSDNGRSITLEAGERIGWANYSNVGQWYPPAPLWQAKLSSGRSDLEFLNLSITVKFHDTRNRYIRRTITYTVN